MAASELAPAESHQSSERIEDVPVLLYHGLTARSVDDLPSREGRYWLPTDQLRRQLRLVREGGHRVALLQDLWESNDAAKDARRAVVLSFDDGRASDYDLAFRLLQENGVRAEFFVNTATVGTSGHLTWSQIAEMHRAGMSIQSHSHDHVVLSLLPGRELRRQLELSKQTLEDRVGSPVNFLAVPYGMSNHQVADAARQVGYRAVCNSWPWPARPKAGLVSRVAIYGSTTLRDFRRLLDKDLIAYAPRAVRSALLHLPKQFLLRHWPNQLGVRVLEARA